MKEKELLALVAAGIRRCRKTRGWTIEELAGRAGIDASFLAHLETRTKSPSLAVLAKIIGALRVSPEELFWGTAGNEGKLAKRLLSLVRGMKRGQREDVLAVLSKLRDPRRARALRVAVGA